MNKIFISSVFDEFKGLREKISQDNFGYIGSLGFEIILLEKKHVTADYKSPSQVSQEQSNESDIFIFLLGEKYCGSCLENGNKSYIHLEYEAAIKKKNKIFAFPVGDCYDPQNIQYSEYELFAQLQRSVLTNDHHLASPYTKSGYDIDKLYQKIFMSIENYIKEVLKKYQPSDSCNCPYDICNLQKNQTKMIDSLNDEIKNRLLTVEINNQKYVYPVIVLIDGEFDISENVSSEQDINAINDNFINTLKKDCNKTIENNSVFRLLGIDEKKKINLSLTEYEKMLSTCDIHYYNALKTEYSDLDFNAWQSELFNVLKNDFSNISAGMGCTTLLVVKNYLTNTYDYFHVVNSQNKNGGGEKHLIPSFMYAPVKMINNDLDLQLEIKWQVLREFGEELLGMEEMEHANDYSELICRLKSNQVIKKLNELLNSKKATLTLLGLSLDIFKLRPEILTTLVVDDEEFFELFSSTRKVSWEVDNADRNGLFINQLFDDVSFSSLLTDRNTTLTPPAVACLVLGRKYLLQKNLMSLKK